MNILALDLGKFNTERCFFNTKTRQHEFLSPGSSNGYQRADRVGGSDRQTQEDRIGQRSLRGAQHQGHGGGD